MYTASRSGGTLRTILLVVFLIGISGTGLELLLLEHFEDWWQRVPLLGLALGLGFAVTTLIRPTASGVRLLRILGVLLLATGAAGLILHFKGNVEFELELHPSMGGLELTWEALRGATPALAPGAIAQLGLLVLAYCYGHPVLKGAPGNDETEETE